jgi:hypothetical protein
MWMMILMPRSIAQQTKKVKYIVDLWYIVVFIVSCRFLIVLSCFVRTKSTRVRQSAADQPGNIRSPFPKRGRRVLRLWDAGFGIPTPGIPARPGRGLDGCAILSNTRPSVSGSVSASTLAGHFDEPLELVSVVRFRFGLAGHGLAECCSSPPAIDKAHPCRGRSGRRHKTHLRSSVRSP